MVVYYRLMPASREAGLIETLFASGLVKMGPSRHDAARDVATFDAAIVARLAAERSAELESFRWLVGSWTWENPVPATAISPAYCDAGSAAFALSDRADWICMVGRDGQRQPMITFDPFSRTWLYVLTQGSYGMLRSTGWSGHQIVFTGLMTMIGLERQWRMTWTHTGDDEFAFVNEEQLAGGRWAYIDAWRYRRSEPYGR